ncbi:MAG: desulfoferrodoxin family protein [Clostridia bacterium]
MEVKFYVCKHCGNIVGFIKNSGVPIKCCGENMTPLTLNSVEASQEKHLPVAKRTDIGITVTVGSVLHPMLENHHIEWIYLETVKGGQRKICVDSPSANFALAPDDMAIAAYAYCNLHGLWRTLI